ncbi:MAG: radical SAM protein [Candidatus Thermoplasmatota archaeon]
MEDGIAAAKAQILSIGRVYVEPGTDVPRTFSRSTAGPDTGERALVLGFNDTRAKLFVSRDQSTPLHLDADHTLTLDGRALLSNVRIEPILLHCPGQAFVNLSASCIYSCAFCTASQTPRHLALQLTEERIIEAVLRAAHHPGIHAVALTSAVTHSPHASFRKMLRALVRLRNALPDIPIGVEIYITEPGWVDMLREAGADEIKLNVETATPEIFQMVCSGRDRDMILRALERAVSSFGEGKVTSNIIFGLGEDDEEVLACAESLMEIGVVPNLRALRISGANSEKLQKALGFRPTPPPPSRLLSLAMGAKLLLSKHRLSTRSFDTMCFPCKCCDLVPFSDL